MINTRIKIHDKFSVEFKTGFFTSEKEKDLNKFKINTWIFVPNGLDINRYTYTKEQFYSDIKTNVRLITPIYSLQDILKEGKGPFPRLERAIQSLSDNADEINTENYIYQIKMLLCILKSALREGSTKILEIRDQDQLLKEVRIFVKNISAINTRYRNYRDAVLKNKEIKDELKEYFLFGDEYLSFITEESIYRLLSCLRTYSIFSQAKPLFTNIIEIEDENKRKMSYDIPSETDEEHNSLILIKRSLLKKFVESDLYLQRIKKTDGAFMREFYYGLAAGVAMIFATVVSFVATQRFGNFTSSLFLVLVISYIFKDRIKETVRYYFSSKLDQKYFDWKWDVSIRNRKIGTIKEAFDFIADSKVPEEIKNLRNKTPLVEAENEVYDEKVILYRKRAYLSKNDLEKYKEYHLSGVNDIMRLNLTSFTKKMDNPTIPIHLPDSENGFKTVMGKRVYALYFIMECRSEEEVYFKKYRLLLNRNGISDVSEIE